MRLRNGAERTAAGSCSAGAISAWLPAKACAIGRVGPLLVHTGMVLLMLGAVWGALAGNRLGALPGAGAAALDLLASQRRQPSSPSPCTDFARWSGMRPGGTEQFRSELLLEGPSETAWMREISVNHPLRHRGITIYQADWSLAAINLQIGRQPGAATAAADLSRNWGIRCGGIVLPTRPDGTAPVLLSLESEQGPVHGVRGGRSTAGLRCYGPAVPPEEVRGLAVAGGLGAAGQWSAAQA